MKPLKYPDGSVVSTWGGVCWQDLPMLGPQMRENWNDDPNRPLDIAAHVNKNMLAARLTALQVMDFSLYGLWALRETLEGETPWCPALPVALTVPSAHAWVMCAGEVLIKLDDDRGKPGQGGSLWTGQNGFCRARWSFWASRLKELSDDTTLSDANRKLAREAALTISELLTSA